MIAISENLREQNVFRKSSFSNITGNYFLKIPHFLTYLTVLNPMVFALEPKI